MKDDDDIIDTREKIRRKRRATRYRKNSDASNTISEYQDFNPNAYNSSLTSNSQNANICMADDKSGSENKVIKVDP